MVPPRPRRLNPALDAPRRLYSPPRPFDRGKMKEAHVARSFVLAVLALLVTAVTVGPTPTSMATAITGGPRPLISDWVFIGNSGTPPSEAACNAVGRRCFNPTAMANSYDYAALHALGNEGSGKTIAIVDSFGASTIREDLGV